MQGYSAVWRNDLAARAGISHTRNRRRHTRRAVKSFGGLHGVRDENALESAIAAAQNVHHYGGGDIYEIAAAYAYHLAESQAWFDGNKRTGIQAALVFLEGCGLDTSPLPEQQTYNLMIRIATHEAARNDLADYLRSDPGRERTA